MILLEGLRLDVCIGPLTWRNIRALAEEYGWYPSGTLAPRDRSVWNGDYHHPAGQTVVLHDAIGMAEALERSIPHLEPEYNILDDYQKPGIWHNRHLPHTLENTVVDLPLDLLASIPPKDYFGGTRMLTVENIMDLAYDGPFFVREPGS